MTYAAAAVANHTPQQTTANTRANLQMFNQTGLSIPPFTNPGLPLTSLQHQYQTHQNYLNYQHQYNLQQQQQPVQRSNFAINELLGLSKNSSSNQYSQSYPSVANSNSPSSSVSSNSSSPTESSEATSKANSNNQSNILINEAAACAAAAAYGAYFSRGGLMGHNFSTSFNQVASSGSAKNVGVLKQANVSNSIGSGSSQVTGGSGPHSPNSDVSEDENVNDEESFGKWGVFVYLLGLEFLVI